MMMDADRINLNQHVTWPVRLRQPICRAVQILQPFTVTILNEQVSGCEGDYLVFHPNGNKFILSQAEFNKEYDILEE